MRASPSRASSAASEGRGAGPPPSVHSWCSIDYSRRRRVKYDMGESNVLSRGLSIISREITKRTIVRLRSMVSGEVGTIVRCPPGAFWGTELLGALSVSGLPTLSATPLDARIERGGRAKADRRISMGCTRMPGAMSILGRLNATSTGLDGQSRPSSS